MSSAKRGQSPGRGLEGVVALESAISAIDGTAGELLYAGYDIRDLARECSFEEVAFLLWHNRLPGPAELDDLRRQLQKDRMLPPEVMDFLLDLDPGANAMAALRTAVSLLGVCDEEGETMSREANLSKAIRLTARMPTVIAAFDRIRRGKKAVAPLDSGSLAGNFLYMLNNRPPSAVAERTFDACLTLHAEHGLNASTFTARVIAATLSDIYSAISGAIGALKGPLHGGANMEVMRTLLEVDSGDVDPAKFVREKLARRERVMGFGHRVYRTLDPRAAILREMSDGLSAEGDSRKWFDISLVMMETMEREKGLYPNVDFFSASVYHTLGIAMDLYTPIFAMSRVTGWTAHVLEQWADNRLIRPRAAYSGPRRRRVPPIRTRRS